MTSAMPAADIIVKTWHPNCIGIFIETGVSMDSNTISRWIIECLQSPLQLRDDDSDCHMVWHPVIFPNLSIRYRIHGNTHGRFVTSRARLEDAINFTHFENMPPYDQDKLERLAEEIENNLRNGGIYDIELISNTDFRIVRRNDGP